MHTHRFGRKLKLPSTRAIKHGILKLMLQDHLDAQILKITGVAGVDTNDGVTSQEDANPRLMVPTRGRPI